MSELISGTRLNLPDQSKTWEPIYTPNRTHTLTRDTGLGHLSAGHAPPSKADRMAKDAYSKLSAAADKLGMKGNKVAFAKIDKLVSACNKAKAAEDQDKIIGQIRGVIKQAQQEEQKKKPEKL